MKFSAYISIVLLYCTIGVNCSIGQQHPSLVLTTTGVNEIKNALGTVPLLDKTLQTTKREVDKAIAEGPNVPIPKDLAGGYSHTQHKRNFFILQKAGALFQITGEEKYARLIKNTLFAYKNLYQNIGLHPATRSYARGKLFWQCLNDANWLVYTSQAYDCIYDWLTKEETQILNAELFRPMADFLSIENPQFFNRIHNHSTWGNAAVGMIGLVMQDEELIQRALYGLPVTENGQIQDNDGGAIVLEGQTKAGFFAQIEQAFSPDGYYTEGPYYQRYAMYPFLIFAMSLSNTRPDLKIFEYKNGVLIKGVYALLDQTDASGVFFPLNDAQKGMSYYSRELVMAVSAAYYYGTKEQHLLPVIHAQGSVPLDQSGLSAAQDAVGVADIVVHKKSIELHDGPEGKKGAIGILRSAQGGKETALVMKYTQHGMGHGHFDRLSYSLYNNSTEIIQDYGAARWVNIEQKDGGGYLKENKTWAKQTIAHNTVVVNRKSQFNGNVKAADAIAPLPYLFETSKETIQVVSAKEYNAYPGVGLHRTMFMVNAKGFANPIVLDLFRVESQTKQSTIELPLLFQGQYLNATIPWKSNLVLEKMGDNSGYQHLYSEAISQPNSGFQQMDIMENNQFVTISLVSEATDTQQLCRIGATDPNFNLRRDPLFLWTKHDKDRALFVTAIEVHGAYSTVTELAQNAKSGIKNLRVLVDTPEYSVVSLELLNGNAWAIGISNKDAKSSSTHSIPLGTEVLEWEGAYVLKNINLELLKN